MAKTNLAKKTTNEIEFEYLIFEAARENTISTTRLI